LSSVALSTSSAAIKGATGFSSHENLVIPNNPSYSDKKQEIYAASQTQMKTRRDAALLRLNELEYVVH
jgi:hypothetical protein